MCGWRSLSAGHLSAGRGQDPVAAAGRPPHALVAVAGSGCGCWPGGSAWAVEGKQPCNGALPRVWWRAVRSLPPPQTAHRRLCCSCSVWRHCHRSHVPARCSAHPHGCRLCKRGLAGCCPGCAQGRRLCAVQVWTASPRGLAPSILQVMPVMGLTFETHRLLSERWPQHASSLHRNLVCGALAGAFSKAVCMPFDVVRKRLQVSGNGNSRAIACALGIIRRDGVKGLYRGMKPSVLKAAISAGVTFFCYDAVMAHLKE